MRFAAVVLLVFLASGVGSFVLGVTLRHVPGPPSFGLGVLSGVVVLVGGLSLLGVMVDPAEATRAAMNPGVVFQEVMESLGGWSAAAVVVGLAVGLPAGFTAADWLKRFQ
jgi:hypothetical protein